MFYSLILTLVAFSIYIDSVDVDRNSLQQPSARKTFQQPSARKTRTSPRESDRKQPSRREASRTVRSTSALRRFELRVAR